MSAPQYAVDALERILDATGGTRRDAQHELCEELATAFAAGEHVIAEAPTGVGKTYAYLAAALASGHKRTLVITSTIALQQQLVGHDLPAVVGALEPVLGRKVDFAIAKGRGNYLCRSATAEIRDDVEAADRFLTRPGAADLLAWEWESDTGDREDLPADVPSDLWSYVSVSGDECPGAGSCRFASRCFSEQARRKMRGADVVVANAHLFAQDIASGGMVLGDFDLVVVDEAHRLPGVVADALGQTYHRGRVTAALRRARRFLAEDAEQLLLAVDRAAAHLDSDLVDVEDEERIYDGHPLLNRVDVLANATRELSAAVSAIQVPDDEEDRQQRLALQLTSLADDLETLACEGGAGVIRWVSHERDILRLERREVDAGPAIQSRLPQAVAMVSATLTVGGEFDHMAERLGYDTPPRCARVSSPFDYHRQGLLYCATDLPKPGRDLGDAARQRLVDVVAAAGGRALVLCTSHRQADQAAETLRAALPVDVLHQADAPMGQLLERFAGDETSVLVGTDRLWQGIDVAGPALSLLVILRLPFARPNQPLVVARTELAEARGEDPFATVSLPDCALQLAQGVGRLIRTVDDTGAVAVLDPRLQSAKRWRWQLIKSLPPFPRTPRLGDLAHQLAEVRARDDAAAA